MQKSSLDITPAMTTTAVAAIFAYFLWGRVGAFFAMILTPFACWGFRKVFKV